MFEAPHPHDYRSAPALDYAHGPVLRTATFSLG
jgi:hypothetical protein